jgi:hypothetical protein
MDEAPASWAIYFPCEDFSIDDRRVKLITSLCTFLLKPEGWEFLAKLRYVLRSYLALCIDVAELIDVSAIRDLSAAVEHQPEECFGCLGAAVYEVLFESDQYAQQVRELIGCNFSPQYIFVRPVNANALNVSFQDIQCGAIGATPS